MSKEQPFKKPNVIVRYNSKNWFKKYEVGAYVKKLVDYSCCGTVEFEEKVVFEVYGSFRKHKDASSLQTFLYYSCQDIV